MLVIYLGKPEILVEKSNGSHVIPFGNPQKIWAVISGDNIFHSQFILFSLIIWMYFVACPSPSTSNFIVQCFCTRFPPRWFV